MNRQTFIFQIEVFVNWAVKLDRSGFACRYPPKAAKAVQCSALPQKMTSPQFERHWTDLPIDNLNLFDIWHVGDVKQFYAIRFSSQLVLFLWPLMQGQVHEKAFSLCPWQTMADLYCAQGSIGALLFRTTLTKEVASKLLSGYKVPKPLGDAKLQNID